MGDRGRRAREDADLDEIVPPPAQRRRTSPAPVHSRASAQMSSIIETSSRRAPHIPLQRDEEAAFRQAYVEMVESGNARAQLVAVARDLRRARDLANPDDDDGSGHDVDDGVTESARACDDGIRRWELFAKWNRRRETIDEHQIFTVGLPGYGNDLELPRGSRMHAIFLPVGHKLFICDVGGKSGFTITERSSRPADAPPPGHDHSRPGARRVLCVDFEETAVLKLGDSIMTINPKECVVCLDAPRTVQFAECRHFLCCDACAPELQRCPICRAFLRRPAISAAHAHSMAQHHQLRGPGERQEAVNPGHLH